MDREMLHAAVEDRGRLSPAQSMALRICTPGVVSRSCREKRDGTPCMGRRGARSQHAGKGALNCLKSTFKWRLGSLEASIHL